MTWSPAPDIKKRIEKIVHTIGLTYIDPQQIFCFRGFGSSSRAIARIWSLPSIWQIALNAKAGYCLEILPPFDKQNASEQDKTLIHELLHIPKTFSGAVVPHRSKFHGRKTYRHYHEEVDRMYIQYLNNL